MKDLRLMPPKQNEKKRLPIFLDEAHLHWTNKDKEKEAKREIDVRKWEEEMEKVQQCPQRQDSTHDQLVDLYKVASKLGFYDAGDVIRNLIEKK